MSLSEFENGIETNEMEGGDAAADPPSISHQRRPVGLVGALLGATLVLSACLCAPLSLAGLMIQGTDEVLIQQAAGPFVLALGLGTLLALEGWQIWQGRPARQFWPRRTLGLWGTFAILLAAGILLSLIPQAPVLPSVLATALTLGMLPLLVLATVGKLLNGAGGTWRDVTGGLIGGAAIGTGFAMIIEVGLAVLGVAFLAIFEVIPGGIEGLQSIAEQISDPSFDILAPDALADLLSPGMVIAALAFIAIATPLIEEVFKTIGVGVAGRWLQPNPPRAFLLGVASGAGFALVENLLNGIVIGALWIPSVLSRLAATLMHCATGGLVGWGWGQLWSERRLKQWAFAFAGAVVLHGVWNGTVGTMVTAGVFGADPENPVATAASGFLILGLGTLLIVLILVSLACLIWGSWTLGRQNPANFSEHHERGA